MKRGQLQEPKSTNAAGQSDLLAVREQLAADTATYEEELGKQWQISENMASKLLQIVNSAFVSACRMLEAEHSALLKTEQEVQHVLNNRCTYVYAELL